MFENNLIAGVSGQGGGYSINDSLRFNDNDSAYLSRTPSVAGNRKTWTWSGWVKRGNINGVRQTIFSTVNVAGNDYVLLEFQADNTLFFTANNGSASAQLELTTNAVFRDTSGWYHIQINLDTSQATSTDRATIYVNGVSQSFSSATYPPLNYDGRINTTNQHNLGSILPAAGLYFDGYLAEINFIDGQALTADDFGQIDADTGEWSPKRYAGTYGTNGFYLPFDGNANDSSGNGNNWTENNLASTDYMIDTPTNNFSTFNALSNISTLSEGNLKTTRVLSNTYYTSISNIGLSSGKWYAEAVFQDTTGRRIGITSRPDEGTLNYFLGYVGSWGYIGNEARKQYNNGTKTLYSSGYSNGDIVGLALDMDSGTLTFYKNGVSQGVAFTNVSGTVYIGISIYGSATGAGGVINFGADSSFAGLKTRQGNTDANGKGDFYYAPPDGYLALCTDNLPAPAIEQPETQFNVVTYTGDGADRNIDVGFEADFVWIKARNSTKAPRFYDRVRGNGKVLFSDRTDAEYSAVNDGIHFDYANGFNIDVGINVASYNGSGSTYVAWCWKAGGTAVSNTDGSITSQVSANVDAGFSVVGWTANGSLGVTVGHGLSEAPELIIHKNRSATSDWFVHTTLVDGSFDYLILNSTAAVDNIAWGSVPTSSVFSGFSYANGNDIISYCFHSVEGFSKFGSYVGNGSADGPFVYTGFKPAFVMIKRTDGVASWHIFDNERSGYNGKNDFLLPNLSDAEYNGTTYPRFDLLSSGFKAVNSSTNTNASGSTYIYMAFAEHPFNYATGR